MNWYELTVDYDDKRCSLEHLRPFRIKVYIPKTSKSAELYFPLTIKFSTHCVSARVNRWKEGDIKIDFPDEGNELRYFSPERYELSRMLPYLLSEIASRSCYFTTYQNYFTFEIQDREDEKYEYQIFFSLKRVKNELEMFVESAYLKEAPKKARKKIRGDVLLAKTFRKEKIKKPR